MIHKASRSFLVANSGFTTKAPPLHRSKNHTKLLRVHFLSVSLYSRTSYPPLAKVTNVYNVIHL